MTRLLRLAFGTTLTAALLAAYVSAASANTFYANTRGADLDNHHCEHPGINACGSVAEAVEQAEQVAGANTIIVQSEGLGEGAVFHETEPLELAAASDNGLTIEGEEASIKVIGPTNKATLSLGAAAGTVTISHLTLEGALGPVATIVDHGANLELEDVEVEADLGSAENGIEAEKGGSLTMEGGGVEMEGNNGYDIAARETPVTLENAGLLNALASGDEAGGVYSVKTGLTIENTKIVTGSGTNTSGDGIHTIEDGSVTLQNDTVQQADRAAGVLLESSPASVDGLTIEMDGGTVNNQPGIYFDAGSSSTVEHLTVEGDWGGPAVAARDEALTIADSHLTTNPAASAEALTFVSEGSGRSLLVQRSILKANPGSANGALIAVDGNVTLDSSEVLGATQAIKFLSGEGHTGTLTVDASTIDAGPPGTASDASNDLAIKAYAIEAPGTLANVDVEGSIALEPSSAVSEEGGQASIACSYSAVPSQSVAASGLEGAIGCAGGTDGNTNLSSELPSLFSEPFSSYALNPASTAIDSVPSSALVLPAGISASATDLAGNPRTVQIGTNGVCATYQDRGALQLAGQASACTPAPPAPSPGPAPLVKPLVGVLTALTLSPSSFYAAPSGPTISGTSKKAKKKYGTKIAYRDSQAATTTFTVLLETTGRKQGKSCQKPSSKNKHGKRCTLLKKVGTFAHTDIAGANSLHFSGRIKGRKLPPGTYELKAVAHDAAGNGKPAEKSFRIEA